MTSILQRAKFELRAAGLFDDDSDFNGDIGVQVSALMETFCAYGHSGGSAEKTVELFKWLAAGKPLTPLTGEDDEWSDVSTHTGGEPLWQNKRYSKVFKDRDRAWNTEQHDKPIKFPYTVA